MLGILKILSAILSLSLAQDEICDPPSFKVNPVPLIHLFDHDIPISVTHDKELDCARDGVRFQWTLYMIISSEKKQPIPNVFKYPYPTDQLVNYLTLSLASPKIPFYEHSFEINVELIPTSGWPTNRHQTFNVVPFDMHVEIAGGPMRDFEFGTGDLVLDASNSSDPSFWSTEHPFTANNLNWSCEPALNGVQPPNELIWQIKEWNLKNLTFTCTLTVTRTGTPFYPQVKAASQHININKVPEPQLTLECVENCTPADTFLPSVLKWDCLANCYNVTPIWYWSPYNPQFHNQMFFRNESDRSYVEVRPNRFRPGDVISFQLWQFDRFVSVEITFRVPNPRLKLFCTANCMYDPRMEVMVQVTCEMDCEINEYKWETTPSVVGNLGEGNSTFTIPAGAFKDGDEVKLSVASWKGLAEMNFTMVEALAKLAIDCKVVADNRECLHPDPREGLELKVTCVENCDFTNYTWSADLTPPGTNWENNTSTSREALKINPLTYSDGDQVTFMVQTGKANTTLNISLIEKIPTIQILCVSNCIVPANPLEVTILQAVCMEDCEYVNYTWFIPDIKPKLVNSWVSNGTETENLSVPKEAFQDGQDVTFIVYSDKANATWSIKFVEPTPNISIVCEANCLEPDPLKETILKVVCTSVDLCPELKYSWDIQPLPENFSWISSVVFGEDNTTITLTEKGFLDGANIVVTVSGRKANASKSLQFKEPIPKLNLSCEQNCAPSHPGFMTILKARCELNCDRVSYNWTMEPVQDNLKWINSIFLTNNNETMSIQPDSFKDGDSIEVGVRSRKGSANLTVKFEEAPPAFVVTCIPPCNETINPLNRLFIQINCTQFCFDNPKYAWSFTPTPNNFSWEENVNMQINNESLLVLPNTFMDGDNITVMVVTEKGNGTANLTFEEPTASIRMECVTNCWEGNPLNDTILTAACDKFCENATQYQWELTPPPPDWAFNVTAQPKNITITIKAETYNDGDVVEATLIMRKANTSASIWFNELKSELNISCTDNCLPDNQSNPMQDVLISVECTANCQKTEYVWSITPLKPDWKWDTNAVLGKNNKTLKINEKSFNDTDVIIVTVENRKASAQVLVRFVESSAQLQLNCTDNCLGGTSNPLKPMTLNVSCLENCEHVQYIWDLLPAPPNFQWGKDVKFGPQNTTLTIKGKLYPDESSTRVVVTSYKGDAAMDIEFKEPIPELNITCDKCDNPNPLEDLTFTVECLEECDFLNYTWDLLPQSRNFTWKKMIKMGKKNESLRIRKYTYQNNEHVWVTVHSGKGEGSAEVIFKMPPPSLQVYCSINCGNSDPSRYVLIKYRCKFCQEMEYGLTLDPVPPDFDWSNVTMEGTDKIFIGKNLFNAGDSIKVTVIGEGITNFTTINFEETIPEITLRCTKNCNYNPKKSVVIEVNCKENCQQKMEFYWTLYPPPLYVENDVKPSDHVEIQGDSYYSNATVTITAKMGNVVSNMTIKYFLPEWEGTCAIEPDSGLSGTTLFAIECDDFINGTTYRVYQTYSPTPRNKLGVLLTYSQSRFTKNFLLSKTKGKSVTVTVGVGWEVKKVVQIKVEVDSFFAQKRKGEEEWDAIKLKVFGVNTSDLGAVLHSHDKFAAVQLVSLLATALDETDTAFRVHYLKHIIKQLLDVATKIEPTQLLSLVMKLASPSEPDAMTLLLLTRGVRIASEQMSKQCIDLCYTEEDMATFAGDALWLASNLMKQAYDMKGALEYNDTSPDYPLYTDLTLPRSDVKRQIKALTVELLAAVDALAQVIRVNETASTSKSENIVLYAADIKGNETAANLKLPTDGVDSYVNMTLTQTRSLQTSNLLYQLAYFRVNPFWWELTSNVLSTELLEFSIAGITWLSTPVSVFLKIDKIPTQEQEDEVSELLVYEFEVAEKSLFTATFEKVNGPYVAVVQACIPDIMTFFQDGRLVNETTVINYFSNSTSVYVGIDLVDVPVTSRFQFAALDCFYWATHSLTWQKEDCMVSETQITGFIHCRCSHLSYFAGRAYIPNSTRRASVEETVPVGTTAIDLVIIIGVSVALLIFIILMMLAHWRDSVLRKGSHVQALADNMPGDGELYIVGLATGLFPTAGTTADVGIQILGELAQTRFHLLCGDTPQTFQRNSEEFFALYTREYLGDLLTIKLWHNSEGSQPHWFCERVIIQHQRTQKKFIFYVESWLSLIYGTRSTHGVFPVNEQKRKQNYSLKLRECLRTSHHVLTLLTQRPRAGATKETVVVGFASCLTAMMAAMWSLHFDQEANITGIIIIAFQSAAVTVPVTLTLNFLFRNSPSS